MKLLEAKIEQRISNLCQEITEIYAKHPQQPIDTITIKHVLGGMRGMKAMVCNTSYVDPYEGLFISGYSVPQFENKTPEEIFFLLCTGTFPSLEEQQELHQELQQRSEVPSYIWNLLRSMPSSTHPMTLFSMGILAMEELSIFKQKYLEGAPKSDYWKYSLEDALNLIAKLPALAAGVYKILFMNGDVANDKLNLDLAGKFTHLLGVNS